MKQCDSSHKPVYYDQNRISVHDCTSFSNFDFRRCSYGISLSRRVPGTMYRYIDSFDSGDREGETRVLSIVQKMSVER